MTNVFGGDIVTEGNSEESLDLEEVYTETAEGFAELEKATTEEEAPPAEDKPVTVVGVRFRRAGRIYYFDPAKIKLELNDWVVVQTSRSVELGTVVIAPKQVMTNELAEPLKPVIRKAEPEDIRRSQEFRAKEAQAQAICQEKVDHFKLPMKLLAAEYNLDGSRLTFFFSAEGRVDFRELVRELAATFRTRVELRQVGPRDEAKIVGGIGRCGRPLCCTTYLCNFNTVSIKMAKEQNLPLNPMKISGTCGRLLCCLTHENHIYLEGKEKLPRVGQSVNTSVGPAKVIGTNPLKETVTVQLEIQAVVELPAAEVSRAATTAQPKERSRNEKKSSRHKG